jgi:hypothetical protein
MPAAEALVQTRDARRYLIRLCQHADKMRGRLGHQPRRHSGSGPPEIRQAEWSDSGGVLTLSLGQCILRAGDGILAIRAEASSAEDLAQIQQLVTRRLEGFGRREQLTVTWHPSPDQPVSTPGGANSDGTASEPIRP